ncbi:unnamed protein product [Tuber aestivum]|uniref:Uncharacterized protein n=1 Tax=Tuber aestivum TaxID=59557 RepID=A0A292Q2H0_9PEZI|nr:unnamed protein product [Tuber aestivum]
MPTLKTPLSRHRAFYTGTITLHLLFMISCYIIALESSISPSTCSINTVPTAVTLVFLVAMAYTAHDKRGIFRGSLEKYGVAITVLWCAMVGVNAILMGRNGGVCIALVIGNTLRSVLSALVCLKGGGWADGVFGSITALGV